MMHLYRGYIIDDDDDDDDDGDGDGDGDDIFQNKLNYAPETLPPTDGQGESSIHPHTHTHTHQLRIIINWVNG